MNLQQNREKFSSIINHRKELIDEKKNELTRLKSELRNILARGKKNPPLSTLYPSPLILETQSKIELLSEQIRKLESQNESDKSLLSEEDNIDFKDLMDSFEEGELEHLISKRKEKKTVEVTDTDNSIKLNEPDWFGVLLEEELLEEDKKDAGLKRKKKSRSKRKKKSLSKRKRKSRSKRKYK